MIKTLALHSFKKHTGQVFEFSPGFNIIQGPNYSGKTSIVQGILYALFGHSASLGGASALMPAFDDKPPEPVHVELTFEVGANTYVVIRKGKNATLAENGTETATSITSVTTGVIDALQMDRTLFEQLRYSPQNETAAMLFAGSGYLQQLIEALANTQLIDRVTKKCDAQKAMCSAQLDALGPTELGTAQDALAVVMDQAETLTKDLDIATREMESRAEVARQLSARVEELDAELSRERPREERRNALRIEHEHLVKRRTALHQLVFDDGWEDSDVDEAEQLADRHRSYVTELSGLHQKRARLDSDLTAITEAGTELRRRAEEAVAETDRARSLLPEGGANAVEALAQSHAQALRSAHESHAHLKAVQSALDNSVCPTCARPYETHDPQALKAGLLQAQGIYSRLYAREQDLRERATRSREALDYYHAQCDVCREMLRLSQENTDQLAALHKDLSTLPASLPDLTSATEVFEEAVRAATQSRERMRQRQHARDEDGQLESRVRELQGQLCGFPPESVVATLEESLRQAKQSYTEHGSAHQESFQRRYAIDQQITQVNSLLETRTRLLEAERKKASQIEQILRRQSRAESLARFLKGNRERFLGHTWDNMLQLTSDFVNICTAGGVTSLYRDDKGQFVYCEGDVTHPLVNASGAQRAIFGTGMRLALSSIMPVPLDVTLLDEITSDMREENALMVAQTLRTFCSGQVISISHRDMDTSVADHVIQLT